MAKYLYQVNYTADGAKGLLKDGGSARRESVQSMIESLGGTMDAYYYAFGDTDLYVIADFPDHAAATAVTLNVAATGTVTCRITVLMTPEELDAAASKTARFRPAGH